MQKLADAEAKKDRQQGKRNDLLGGNATKLGGKNTVQHILRRLARDHEDIFTKVKSGALTVNAAAIAAGIRKKPTPAEIVVKTFAKVEDRLETLKKIVGTLSDAERQVVKDWLTDSR